MADGPGIETFANHTNSASNGLPPDAPLRAPRSAQDIALQRALVFIGIAAASAGLAYAIVRTSLKTPPPADPTTERIQQLIDEANRLLKALDEKKPD
jgi:hypothetical protein